MYCLVVRHEFMLNLTDKAFRETGKEWSDLTLHKDVIIVILGVLKIYSLLQSLIIQREILSL